MKEHGVVVNGHELRKQMEYENTPILKYTIKYPQFSLSRYQYFTNRLNRYYQDKAFKIVQYCESIFYKSAADSFDDLKKEGGAFHEYEFFSEYTVTENRNSCLSIYFDEYKYKGGANGTTSRHADNWDTLKGRRLTLTELYPDAKNYSDIIKEEINRQIAERLKTDKGAYFPDYQRLVTEYYDPKNFYLVPEGVIIFFQEVTVAPHSGGIITFELPYVRGPFKPAVYEL